MHTVKSNNLYSKWIIDTGATDHITPYLSLLQDVQVCTAALQLPNGNTSEITHVGNLMLNSQLILTNVLCVPTFLYNLLSVSKLLQDTTYQVTFVAASCHIKDKSWQTDIELEKEENGLYILIDTTAQ